MNKPTRIMATRHLWLTIRNKFEILVKNRSIRIAVQIFILSVCVVYLTANFRNARDLITGIRVNYAPLALSCLLATLSVYIGAFSWGLILNSLELQVPWRESFRIHLVSTLAKYIPGYAWQLLGKAYLTRRSGASRGSVGFAMILELAQLILIGAILAIAFFPKELFESWFGASVSMSFYPWLRITGISGLILIPITLFLFFQKEKFHRYVPIAKQSTLLISTLSIFLGWLLLGTSFWLIGRSIAPLTDTDISRFTFVLAASVLIGLAIIVVPGSIGIRESIMVYLLTQMGYLSTIAVLIAILSRLILTFGELFGYALYVLVLKTIKNNDSVSQIADE